MFITNSKIRKIHRKQSTASSALRILRFGKFNKTNPAICCIISDPEERMNLLRVLRGKRMIYKFIIEMEIYR